MRNLSVAEQQLVEIAKALSLPNADIIIMDEPTSAIDEEDAQKIFQTLQQLASKVKALFTSLTVCQKYSKSRTATPFSATAPISMKAISPTLPVNS